MTEKFTEEEKRRKKSERKRERELSDIRFVIKSPEGRRFLWRVIEEGRVFQDVSSSDVQMTYRAIGGQNVSRRFLNDLLDAKPEALTQMQQERESEAESERVLELKEQENKGVLD